MDLSMLRPLLEGHEPSQTPVQYWFERRTAGYHNRDSCLERALYDYAELCPCRIGEVHDEHIVQTKDSEHHCSSRKREVSPSNKKVVGLG